MKKFLAIITHKASLVILLIAMSALFIFQTRQVFTTNAYIQKFIHHAGPQHAHFINDLGVEYLDARIVHEIYQMFKDVSELLDKNNIKYWASGGTLLGSVRHEGFIPWDDDVDIAILDTDVEKLSNLKAQLNEIGYDIDMNFSLCIKIFPMTGVTLAHDGGLRYPYLDIFPMKELDGYYTHITKQAIDAYSYDTFSKADIDNLKRCKFGNIEVWCPDNAEANLKGFYGRNVMIESVFYGLHYTPNMAPKVKWKLRPWEFGHAKSGILLDRVKKN